jgi:phosphate transport system substrate-binding protein
MAGRRRYVRAAAHDARQARQGAETLKFFDWAFKNGTQAADSLDYISLPESVVTEIKSQWKDKVKDASGKSVAE